MTDLQLEDLVYTYPDIYQPGFQTKISAKWEFQELAAPPHEKPMGQGRFFRHQELILRYMLMYDHLLLIHETGTGKTCAGAGVAEKFREDLMDAIGNFINFYLKPQRTHIKRVYILVRGKALKFEFQSQLTCQCAKPGVYGEEDIVKRAKTVKARRSALSRVVGRYYEVVTYGSFASKISKKFQTDEQLRLNFSDSLFIVDEAHNLQIRETDKKAAKSEKGLTYSILHRLFHVVERSKFMLMTATPMINDPAEIAAIMNLLLPLNSSTPNPNMPFGTNQLPMDIDYNQVTLQQVEPYFRGRISYVRSFDLPIKIQYVGSVIQADQTIAGKRIKSQQMVYPVTMRDFQAAGYIRALILAPNEKRKPFNIRERQASNFVFPDGKSGSPSITTIVGGVRETKKLDEAFNKYVKPAKIFRSGKTIDDPDNYTATPELNLWLKDDNKFMDMSMDYATIFNIAHQRPGNVFIYSDFLEGGGAAVLGLAFEARGYDKFKETKSIFAPVSGSRGLPPLCSARQGIPRMIRAGFKKKPRYALLHGKTPDTRFRAALEAFNSKKNMHGEYIKILIVSPVGREGLNTANVQSIILPGPSWNEATVYQAISRGIRATSHDDLIEYYRQRGEEVVVNIYQMASLLPRRTEEEQRWPQDIDIKLYLLSETKNIKIKRMLRLMKQSAIDCMVHRRRNIRPTDVDGSADCDYSVCDYRCADTVLGIPASIQTDYSSYDVLYSGPLIATIAGVIRRMLHLKFSLNIEILYDNPTEEESSSGTGLLQSISAFNRLSQSQQRKFIQMAVELLISVPTTLTDRYGHLVYPQLSGNIVYLQEDYPTQSGIGPAIPPSRVSSATGLSIAGLSIAGPSTVHLIEPQLSNYGNEYYTHTLLAYKSRNLRQIVADYQQPSQRILIGRILSLPPSDPQLESLVYQLNLESRVKLLEDILSLIIIQRSRTPIADAIIKLLGRFIYQTPEPELDIQEKARGLSTRGTGRGRKPGKESKPKISKKDIIGPAIIGTGEEVYLHTLYGQRDERTAFNMAVRFERGLIPIRILKPSKGNGWRDVNIYETPIYNIIIRQENERRDAKYEQYQVYGKYIVKDKTFSIRSKLREDPNKIKDDVRHKYSGKN